MEVKLPEFASGENVLDNILSISVLEGQVSRVGCKIYRKKELEARGSRNSLVGLYFTLEDWC